MKSKVTRIQRNFNLIDCLPVIIVILVFYPTSLFIVLNQISPARESQGRNTIETINLAQQKYHIKEEKFLDNLKNTDSKNENPLGVVIPKSKYYTFKMIGDTNFIAITAQGINISGVIDHGYAADIRDQSGGIIFNHGTDDYKTLKCIAEKVGDIIPPLTATNINSGTCPSNSSIVK